MSVKLSQISGRLRDASVQIVRANVALTDARNAHALALRELESPVKELLGGIIAALKEGNPSLAMTPSTEALSVEFNGEILHVRFTQISEPLARGTIPVAAGAILNVIAKKLREKLRSDDFYCDIVMCTLPDHWWKQDELARLPIV